MREGNFTEKGFMYGLMVPILKEISKRESSKVKENGGLKMVNFLLVLTEETEKMALVVISGRMA